MMKRIIFFLLIITCVESYSQNTEKLTKPIIEEGKRLYKLEH